MYKHPIVVIAGRKRSGKNTLADILTKLYGYKNFAFADGLREVTLATDPIISWDLKTNQPIRYSQIIQELGYEQAKDVFPEIRRFLQNLGSEGIRKLDEDFWVNQTFKRVRGHQGPACISDCRFISESEIGQLHGALVVLLKRPGNEDLEDTHQSEAEVDQLEPDMIVYNDLNGFNYLENRAKEVHAFAVAKMQSLTGC